MHPYGSKFSDHHLTKKKPDFLGSTHKITRAFNPKNPTKTLGTKKMGSPIL